MWKPKPLPSQDYLKSRLDYDPETGFLTWLKRLGHTKGDRIWNTKYVGKRAGWVDKGGYRRIKIDKEDYAEHRIVFQMVTGDSPSIVDHIDGNTGNNTFANLRVATYAQNNQNARQRINNTSGFKNVSWFERDQTWLVGVSANGRRVQKHFKGLDDACRYAEYLRQELHAEFRNDGLIKPTRQGTHKT